MVKIINLTNKSVTVLQEKGEPKIFKPSGNLSKIFEYQLVSKTIDGITFFSKNYEKELPDQKDNVYYIVEESHRKLSPNRKDLISPYGPIHDYEGFIIAYHGFRTNE
jgi:hypothetical protein